jgi:hypothetical protein
VVKCPVLRFFGIFWPEMDRDFFGGDLGVVGNKAVDFRSGFFRIFKEFFTAEVAEVRGGISGA